MPQPAYTRTAILQALLEHGNMSAAEITEVLQLPRTTIHGSLAGARKKYGTWFFRITGWRRQQGQGGREIPIYGPGPGTDAPRPDLGAKARRETQQRYADRHRTVINLRAQRKRGRLNPFMQLVARAA